MNDKSLSQEVLDAIESQGIRPRGKVSVWAGWAVVWLVWALVLVFGALAVSGTIFAIALSQWQFRRITDQSFLGLFAESLPLLWAVFIVLAVVLLTEIYRRTDTGYRASTLWVVGVSLVGTGLMGALLYTIGAGELVEREIGARIPMHRTVDERNVMRLASVAPEFVKLGEVLESRGEDGEPVYTLAQISGETASLRFDRPELAQKCLEAGRSVQLIGFTDFESRAFVVCDAQPILLQRAQRSRLERVGHMESPSTTTPIFLSDRIGDFAYPQACDDLQRLLMRERSR